MMGLWIQLLRQNVTQEDQYGTQIPFRQSFRHRLARKRPRNLVAPDGSQNETLRLRAD